MVQVLLHPSDPDVIVVRWGFASEGYLYSRDGGKTFAALCSEAISSEPITRISGQPIPGAAANLIDSTGHLLMTQLDGLWSDDGTGCAWTKDPTLDGFWPYSLLRDPAAPDELLAIVNRSDNTDPTNLTAQSRVMRRAADGTWTPWESAGALRPHVAQQRAYGNELIGAKTSSGTRLYASASVSRGPLSATTKTELWVVHSDDGGKTWSAPGGPLPPEQSNGLVLLGVDPLEPMHLLAARYRDQAPDTLLFSEDGGATFAEYMGVSIRETAGVTFAADGRVFVGDAGDASGIPGSEGGLYTAPRLGMPLSKVPNTDSIDCVSWSQANDTLYACKRDKVGTLSPVDGSFAELVRVQTVPALLSCQNMDVAATCEHQLNMGSSWCCAGHYPFTPFCGQYDVTFADGRHVMCGKSGQAYDESVGRGPDSGVPPTGAVDLDGGVPSLPSPEGPNDAEKDAAVLDAGKTDAGKVTDGASSKSDDGCSLTPGREPSGLLFGLGLLGLMRLRFTRKRRA